MNGKQLKNSILQWAIQGKLVPQDPNDEPASVLLEKIRAEKARLIKEGKIKKEKKESIIYRGEDNSYYEKFADGKVVCIDEEIPFEIPNGWELARFGSVMYNRDSERIPLSVAKRSKLTKIYDYYGASGVIDKVDKYLFNKDLLLIGEDGANLINRSKPIAYIATGKYWVNNHAHVLDCIDSIFMQYICLYINSISLVDYVTGTAQPKMNQEKMNSILLPLPPHNEQKRILQKVDKIQPLFVRYEKNQSRLEALTKTLYINLRKSILHEAIQGKLVPQAPNDEPAPVLLQRIKEEKQRLVKEGKLKKKDVVDSIIYKGDDNKYYEQIGRDTIEISNEILFDLPCSWQWVRFGQIVRMSIGKTPARGEVSYWSKATIPWVSISDMTNSEHINKTKEKISVAASSVMGEISPVGSLLMSFKLTVGRTSILNIDAYHNEAIISIYPFIDDKYALRDYLFYTLPFLSNMGDSKDAIKGKTLNSKSLKSLLIPLPPLREQRCIINRLEELYAHL